MTWFVLTASLKKGKNLDVLICTAGLHVVGFLWCYLTKINVMLPGRHIAPFDLLL